MRPFLRFARPSTAALAAVLLGVGLLAVATLLPGLPARALPPVINLDSESAGLTLHGGDAAHQPGWAQAARAPASGAGTSEQGLP